jgi:hypothetical protein
MRLLFVLFVGMIRTHLEISTPTYSFSCHLGNHSAFLVCQISRHTNVRLLRYSNATAWFLAIILTVVRPVLFAPVHGT